MCITMVFCAMVHKISYSFIFLLSLSGLLNLHADLLLLSNLPLLSCTPINLGTVLVSSCHNLLLLKVFGCFIMAQMTQKMVI